MNAIKMISAAMLLSSGAVALAQTGKQTSNTAPPNPTEVALIDHADAGGLLYNKFPTGERLYISETDPIGRSLCNSGCSSAWPPVLAPAEAKPVGSWSIVVRDDGSRQWALAGKPVYMRFHDVYAPTPGWRLLSEDLARAMTGR